MPKHAVAKAERQHMLPAVAHEVYRAFLHGKSVSAIAREFTLDPRTAKKYIDALLREQQPARNASRDRLRGETLAKLNRVYQHAWGLVEADPENTAALNVLVRVLREESKLRGLYADIAATVEHTGAVEIRVVYRNDWRNTGRGGADDGDAPSAAVAALTAAQVVSELPVADGAAGADEADEEAR